MAKRSLRSTTGFATYGGAEHLERNSFVTGQSLAAYQLPQSPFFWINSRGVKLHIRSLVPSKISESTAVAVLTHGFSVHWNLSRTIGCLQTYAEALDLILFAYDQEGHGYSGGDRGVIQEYTHLVDDLVELVQLIHTAKEASCETYNLCPPEILAHVQGREFGICGDSLGGGVALAATVRLQESPNRPAVLMLFAPFLQAHVPFGAGKSFVSVVKSIPSLRNMNLPLMLVPEFKGEMLFTNKNDVKIFEMDRSPAVRCALGFPMRLKAATAASITAMCDALPKVMPQLEIPLIIFHDPEDSIAPIEGSLRLIELATCPRELVLVPGGLHAPHFNKGAEVQVALGRFLRAHLQCRSCSTPADSQDDQVGDDDEYNEGADEFDGQLTEETEGSNTYTGSATLPLALQRLKLERPAFERFPLPSKCNETLVLLIYLVTLLAIASSPTIMAVAHSPTAGGWTLIGLGLGLQATMLFICMNYLLAILKTRRARRQSKLPLMTESFAILVPMYNEDVEVLRPGLVSINEQPQASNVTVIVGFEARAGQESNAERERAVRKILTRVKAVYVFTHPEKVPGHIKGCGSNQSWAMNQFLEHVQENVSDWVFAKIDAQVVMQPGLLTELEHRMVDWKAHRRPVLWQPTVLHTINNRRAYAVGSLYAQITEFFITGIITQPLFSLFVYGQYAMPMEQYVRAGMHHPALMAEDIAISIECAWTNRNLVVQPLDHCVAKAPPMGNSLTEAIGETMAQVTRFFVGTVLILPWSLLHDPSTLNSFVFPLKMLLVRHFASVGLPIMTFQALLTVGFGLVQMPIEGVEKGPNGVMAVAAPTFISFFVLAVTFATLQNCMVGQWPGKESQSGLKAILCRIIWLPVLQTLICLAESRALLLCIFYGSAGQHGPLQYKVRKKLGLPAPQALQALQAPQAPQASKAKPATDPPDCPEEQGVLSGSWSPDDWNHLHSA